jgi:hypothetical protein
MQKKISKKQLNQDINNLKSLGELNEATFAEKIKYLAAKHLPSYKVGDKIFGTGQEGALKAMEAKIQKIVDEDSEGLIKTLHQNLQKNYPEFPNNEEKETFLKGVLEISAVYDSIVAATKRQQNPLLVDEADKYIEKLRQYVNYIMSYKLNRTIYSTMNEMNNYNESEDIELKESKNSLIYVQYHSDMRDEDPFMLHGEKWQFVNAIYPDGKKDIGVYRYAGDMVYSYEWFRRNVVGDKSMGELDEATMADINTSGGLSSDSVRRALGNDRTARGGIGNTEFDSEVMKGLKSNRLPLTLGVVGAVLAAAGWVGQSQWFIDFIKGLKEVDVKLTQDIIERNIKIDPRGFSYTLQNNLPAGEAVNLNFNQPVENLRKALEFYGNGDLRQGVNASSLFIDPSQRASSVSNLLQQLSDPSNKTIGDIFNVGENTYGRAGTLFSQYGGAKSVIAKYFVNRIITTIVKTGAGYAVGTALIAAAPALIGVGIGSMVAGALVKLMRLKGQKSSRAATLDTLLQSLRPLPNPNPVIPPKEGEGGGEVTPPKEGEGGGGDGKPPKDGEGGGDGKPPKEGEGGGKKTEPINNLMNVLRNLFIDVDKVKQQSKLTTEADKRQNFVKRGGLDFINLDKNEKTIFINNMKRMIAVIKAVERLNVNKKTYPELDRILRNITSNKAYADFKNINNTISQYESRPKLLITLINAYNEAIKTTEFANLKNEIKKNLPSLVNEAPKNKKAAPVVNPVTPTNPVTPEVKSRKKISYNEILAQDMVQLFKYLYILFRKVNEIIERGGAGSQPKGQGQPAPGIGNQGQGQPSNDGGNKLNDPSQEVSEGKNKYSKKASSFIGKEISHLKKDKGYSQERAVAAAINVAKDKGMKVGAKKKK